MSQQLVDDIRLLEPYLPRAGKFVVGYLASYLPIINRKILDERYKKGHLLIRTFSIFDLFDVGVLAAGKIYSASWPQSFAAFPPLVNSVNYEDKIYVRDFIDACNSYFNADYDDCIRRVITSAENLVRDKDGRLNLKVSAINFGGFCIGGRLPIPILLERHSLIICLLARCGDQLSMITCNTYTV